LAAAIVRLHITRGTAVITVILATRTTATTRATTAMAGEDTIGLGGGIDTTAGIMVGGTGTGGAARTAGIVADGTAITDSESRSHGALRPAALSGDCARFLEDRSARVVAGQRARLHRVWRRGSGYEVPTTKLQHSASGLRGRLGLLVGIPNRPPRGVPHSKCRTRCHRGSL